MLEVNTPGILDEFEYKGFWISWNEAVMAVGVVGDPVPKVSYHHELVFRVRKFGVRTGWGVVGDWVIDCG